MIMIIFAIIVASVLVLLRRKLGTFILAIFAGAYLNRFWNGEITNFLAKLNLNIPHQTLAGIVGLLIILIPAFLVLGKSGKRDKWIFSVIVGVLSAIFVSVMCAPNLSVVFAFDDISRQLLSLSESNHNYIIVASIILAIFEILSVRSKKPTEKS